MILIQTLIQIGLALAYMSIFNIIIKKVVDLKYLSTKNVEIRYLFGYLGTLVFATAFAFIWEMFNLHTIFLMAIVYGGVIVGVLTCLYALSLVVFQLLGKKHIYNLLVSGLRHNESQRDKSS